MGGFGRSGFNRCAFNRASDYYIGGSATFATPSGIMQAIGKSEFECSASFYTPPSATAVPESDNRVSASINVDVTLTIAGTATHPVSATFATPSGILTASSEAEHEVSATFATPSGILIATASPHIFVKLYGLPEIESKTITPEISSRITIRDIITRETQTSISNRKVITEIIPKPVDPTTL